MRSVIEELQGKVEQLESKPTLPSLFEAVVRLSLFY